MIRVDVKPELLRWACARAGLDPRDVADKIPQLRSWDRGEQKPTLKQLEKFAKATHVPVGYLFLPKPPVERLPIPDLRTIGNVHIGRPSPDLLETIYICQQRQEWYRDFTLSSREGPLPFVGSVTITSDVESTAAEIRHALGFDRSERRAMPTWTDALRAFVGQADGAGVLVMVSGIVGNNTHRRLDPDEFRGFALSDEHAPLVFINGTDSRSAQMFTLAHELAHIWLGESALSDIDPGSTPSDRVERWCNAVAAETLVPLSEMRSELGSAANVAAEVARLARVFKVSTLVVLRRILDAGALTRGEFRVMYEAELQRLLAVPRGTGGDFYRTQPARVSRRFARALVASTLEGQTLYRDAFRMLGVSKVNTFYELGRSLGIG